MTTVAYSFSFPEENRSAQSFTKDEDHNNQFNIFNSYNSGEETDSGLSFENVDEDVERLIQLFHKEYISGLKYIVRPEYHEETDIVNYRFTFSFEISPSWLQYYGILRGYLVLAKPEGFSVNVNIAEHGFLVELGKSSVNKAVAYFELIFGWLIKEAVYRNKLKQIFALDEKYAAERKAILEA